MFIIQIPYLNLNQTYNSGQCLRWYKINDDKFIVIHGDKIVKVSQNKDRFCFDCTEEVFYNTWFDYFDMQTDYLSYNYKSKKIDDEMVQIACVRGSGIRLIKRGMYESVVTSIIDDFCNGDNATTMSVINILCNNIGKKHVNTIRDIGRFVWYEFPSAYSMTRNKDVFRKLIDLEYLTKAQVIILRQICLYIDVKGFKGLPKYMKEKGLEYAIGSINLFGRHKLNYMPMNYMLAEAIETCTDCGDAEYLLYAMEDAGVINICGLIGRYIYYNKYNPPRRLHGVQ